MDRYEWVHSDKQAPWDITSLKETMCFAAERMIEMLRPSDKLHQDMQKHIRWMSATPNLDTRGILGVVASMYTMSIDIHGAAMRRWGWDQVHDWSAVFLEYQSMMSCALRHLQKEADKDLPY